jgi:hypothetical protein
LEEKRKLSDTFIVTYLVILGFTIKPLNQGRLISFEVSGEGLSEAIEGFYSNPPVHILDFYKSYRSIRSAIFNMRGER